jgi:hypothetical protein
MIPSLFEFGWLTLSTLSPLLPVLGLVHLLMDDTSLKDINISWRVKSPVAVKHRHGLKTISFPSI